MATATTGLAPASDFPLGALTVRPRTRQLVHADGRSGDPGPACFSDGVTEEVRDALGRLKECPRLSRSEGTLLKECPHARSSPAGRRHHRSEGTLLKECPRFPR